MKLNHKLSFHIPHVAYAGACYIEVPYEKFRDRLAEKLADVGVEGWHVISAVGAYKGRKYPQDIFVVFCDYESQKPILEAYEAVCREMAGVMRQESFGYEHDGVFVVFDLN